MSLITQLILPLKNVALVDFVANPVINTLNIIAKFIPPYLAVPACGACGACGECLTLAKQHLLTSIWVCQRR